MGTDKRERQKQARQEKIDALRQQEQRESVRRRGVMIAVAILAFVAFAIGFSVLTADDDGDTETATEDTTPDEFGDEPEDGADPADDPTDEEPTTDEEPSTDEPDVAAEPLPCPGAEGAPERVTEFPAPPPTCIESGVDYTATMVTDAGTIEIDLLEEQAPETVNNFVYLARYRYYEGIDFHRVIPDFVVQGGDPQGTGAGGPGYSFGDELPEDGYQTGSVAMANSGPDTNGSQFFIVTSEAGAGNLQPLYSLFGQVTDGMDVVKAIEADGSAQGTPETVHVIESVTINES